MSSVRNTAARVAGVYAIVGAAWILFSDEVVKFLPPALRLIAQTWKGLLFVVVTATTLYFVIGRREERIESEQKAAESAERVLGQVFDTAPVGMLLTTDDGVITFVNPSAERILGAHLEDIVGHTLAELCCAEPMTEPMSDVSRLLQTGAVDGLRLSRPGEEAPRAVVARAAAIDPDRPISGLVVALADITESHQASERASRLLGSYRFLADAYLACGRDSDIGQLLNHLCMLATQDGHYRAAVAMLERRGSGRAAECFSAGLGETSQRVVSLLQQGMVPGTSEIAEPLAEGRVAVTNDLRRDPANPYYAAAQEEPLAASGTVTAEGGAELHVEFTLFASEPGRFDTREVDVLQSLRGALEFALQRIELEAQRLDAEHALETSEQAYRTLFEAHPMPMYVFDTDTLSFLAVNDAAQRKYGYSAAEFKRMTISDIRPPEEQERLATSEAATFGQSGDAGVWTHRDRNGRAFPVHVYSGSIMWEGRRAKLVMIQEVARVE